MLVAAILVGMKAELLEMEESASNTVNSLRISTMPARKEEDQYSLIPPLEV